MPIQCFFQAGLSDYDFELRNLIEGLRDGVRLCRLVQILLCDTSILMVKLLLKFLNVCSHSNPKRVTSLGECGFLEDRR